MTVNSKLLFMMMLEYAIAGAYYPKLFPYMQMLGFSAWQMGLVGSCSGIATVVAIFFSNQYVDRRFSAERFLAFSLAVAGAAMLALPHVTTFWTFFALFLIFSLMYVPTYSVTNAIAFTHMRDPARDFGVVRMGGTLGWIVISWPFIFLLSEKADIVQIGWIFNIAAIGCFVLSAYALILPRTPPLRAQSMDKFAWRETFNQLKIPFIGVIFLVAFLDAVVFAGYFIVTDGFLTNEVGIAANMSMLVLSIGQVAEIVTMIVLGPVLARLGWKTTLTVGILGNVIRYVVFAFFPRQVWLIVGVQVMQGLCYAFFFATVCIFVDEVFPKDVRASAQGLLNLTIAGFGHVAASMIFPYLMQASMNERVATNGAIHAEINYTTVFLVPAAAALVIVAILWAFFRPPHSKPRAGAV